MDDMQRRIAARRAEIERNRLAEGAAPQAAANAGDEEERVRERAAAARANAREAAVKKRNAERAASSINFGTDPKDAGADTSDIFESLFGAGQAAGNVGRAQAQGQGDQQASPAKPGTDGKVQDRVAARRAEIEGERARAAAAADARRAEEKAAAEMEWAERARQEKARLDLETPAEPARKAAMDRMLREAVRKRWTSNQWKGFGVVIVVGVLLLNWQPVWGAVMLLFGAASYWAINSTHRDAVLKDYPDLFAPASARKEP